MGSLSASTGEVDLAPPAGVWMSGFSGRVLPSTGVHDSIMARALLLDDGCARLAIVSCDLLGLTPLAVAQLRDRIARQTGGTVAADSVMIACTHTHSGPASLPMRGVMGCVDGPWLRNASRKIVELVAGLARTLRPARLAVGRTTLGGVGFNRQDPTQPVDEELIAVAVDALDGERATPIATLAAYATHAVVLGPANLLLSGDFPGAAARALAAARGGIGLFLQGASGDVDPVVNRDRGWGTGTFDDARLIGECISHEAMTTLAGARWTDDPEVRTARTVLRVPLDRAPPPAELERLAAAFDAERSATHSLPGRLADELAAEAMLDWVSELASAERLGIVPRFLPAELFVAGIGDLRIVGAPFEIYSGIASEIRRGLRPLPTIVAGCANGLYGYCPTTIARRQGGYGPESSHRWFPALLTPVGFGADKLLVREARAMGRKGVVSRQCER